MKHRLTNLDNQTEKRLVFLISLPNVPGEVEKTIESFDVKKSHGPNSIYIPILILKSFKLLAGFIRNLPFSSFLFLSSHGNYQVQKEFYV